MENKNIEEKNRRRAIKKYSSVIQCYADFTENQKNGLIYAFKEALKEL